MIFFVLNMNSIGKIRKGIFIKKFISLFNEKDYREYEVLERLNNNSISLNTHLDWKKNFGLGLTIKNNWKSLCSFKKNFIPNLAEDSEQICEEIYSTIKGKKIHKLKNS
jgi:hypothetical protein